MTRAELISRLADRLGHLPAGEVKAAVLAITERLGLALQNGERVEIRGFGGFSLHRRPPRVGRNPKTGEAVNVAARFAVHFKPGKELRERVTAIKLSVYWNAKPQLGIRVYHAKLGLGVPSRADFTLNAS